MEEYLEKKLYVFRKSYNYYYKISIILLILKLLFSASGISGMYYFPLSLLSLISGILEILEKSIKQNERIVEYRLSHKFYKQMLNYLRAGKINMDEINIRETEFIENIQFFPREKYIKQAKLNGYNFINC